MAPALRVFAPNQAQSSTPPRHAGISRPAPDPRQAIYQRLADESPQVARASVLQQRADAGVRSGVAGLPASLAAGIEQLSGIAMHDVEVHYGSREPAAVNAVAFARGTQIHLERGREDALAHEAWHVVQQKQGRVGETSTLRPSTGSTIAINDDRGLEREASVMGERAVRLGESGAASPASLRSGTTSAAVTQRMPKNQVLEIICKLTGKDSKPLASYLEVSTLDAVATAIANATTAWDQGDESKLEDLKIQLEGSFIDIELGDLDPADPDAWLSYLEKQLRASLRQKPKIEKKPEKQKPKKADYAPALLAAQKLGKGSKDLADRIVLECAMGQGVHGDLRKYALFSAGFSSCTPVVLWNGKSYGGLFHWAAGTSTWKTQARALLDLAQAVGPAEVYLGNHDQNDLKNLSRFFKENFPNAECFKIKAAGYRFAYLEYSLGKQSLRIEDTDLRAAASVDLTQVTTKPSEIEKLDFDMVADPNSMDPDEFQAVYGKYRKKGF